MHQLASDLINRFQKQLQSYWQMVKTLSCLLKKYGKNGFGKSVTGQYSIVATLPTGYELAEEAPVISVVAGHNNNYRIGVVSKVDLLAALNNQADVTRQRNTSMPVRMKEAYDQALQMAQKRLDQQG